MGSNYILLSFPIFFALIAVEYLVSRAKKREDYHFADSVNSLSCGISQQVVGLLLKFWDVGLYMALYELWHLADLPYDLSRWGILACILGFVLYDFGYYWFHRSSHRVNFMWAAHTVHHQSEEYNLTTALRQSLIQSLFSTVFSLPMALLGIHPILFATVRALNTLYQFWIHTRLIGKLGPLEWVLNTPSHHRVHHGIDPKYIDKNHGGMFIVWDRLFGTFQEEEEEPNYGTVKPLMSWNPLWANLEGWARMMAVALKTERFIDKVGIFVRPPEWLPEDLGGPVIVPEVDPELRSKHQTELSGGQVGYFALHLLLATLTLSALLSGHGTIPLWLELLFGGWVLLSLMSWGALMESRRGARWLELVRLLPLPWVFLLSIEVLMVALGSDLGGELGPGWRQVADSRFTGGIALGLGFMSAFWMWGLFSKEEKKDATSELHPR